MVALGITQQLSGTILMRKNHLMLPHAHPLGSPENRLLGASLACNVKGLAQVAQVTDATTAYRYRRT